LVDYTIDMHESEFSEATGRLGPIKTTKSAPAMDRSARNTLLTPSTNS
jgi:hypothetical protein